MDIDQPEAAHYMGQMVSFSYGKELHIGTIERCVIDDNQIDPVLIVHVICEDGQVRRVKARSCYKYIKPKV